MKPTIYFLMNSIDIMRGGLTRASLKQASFFAEMGYKTYMLTFNFNPNYPRIRHQLKEMKMKHKNVIIRNMYEDFAGDPHHNINTSPPEQVDLNEITEGLPYDKRKGHNAYRVYKNGAYYKYINIHGDGYVSFIDYFNENRYRTKRVIYDPWGHVIKIAYMDLVTNKPRQLIHFNKMGQAFFTQWNNPETEDIQRIIIFNEDSSIKRVYVNDPVSHKVDWLKDVISENNNKSVVISDTRSTDQVLVDLEHPKAAKIWRLHSNHVNAPYELDTEIAPAVQTGYDNIDKFDVAVLLTEEQRKDVINRTNKDKNTNHLKVIPHYHEANTSFVESIFNSVRTDEKLAVIVSRLTTLKRIDHAIRAFKLVTETFPDARLEIWGKGPQKAHLKKLIGKLKLKENVFLKGYTHTPDKIYKMGLFSILTSKSEGFALSVLESMYNKTPVISYNVRYGPTDMIVDKKNGFIVDNGDIEALAEKMIWMFGNPNKALRMGSRSRKYINQHFNKQIYKDKWLETIDAAMESKFKKQK